MVYVYINGIARKRPGVGLDTTHRMACANSASIP
jgi:hypothetical protein